MMISVEENKINQQTQTQQTSTETVMAASQAETEGHGPRCEANPLPECPGLKKLLFVLLGLILVGGLVWVAYSMGKKTTAPVTLPPAVTRTPEQATPTPDGTANWKTYKDEKNGIEFKYPNDWYAKPLSGWTFNIFLENHSFEISKETEFMTSIQISFNEVENTVTNKKFFSEKTLNEGTKRIKSLYDERTIRVNNLVVGGKKAVQISGLLGPGPFEGKHFIYTLIQMDDHLLEVSLTNKEFKNIYDQILATFKFLDDQESALPTKKSLKNLTYFLPSGWKTVSNSTGTFEVGYDPEIRSVGTNGDVIEIRTRTPELIMRSVVNFNFFLLPYNGGSRHQFIYDHVNSGSKPEKQDLMSGYREVEFLYNNQSCLFLVGVVVSQFPTTWGMCDAGGGKAFLMTANQNDDAGIEMTVRTIRLLK